MFSQESPEEQVSRLYGWFVEDESDSRMLPMAGLGPLTALHGNRSDRYRFQDELTCFQMELMSAIMSLAILLPTRRSIIVRLAKGLDETSVDNFLRSIVYTPFLSCDQGKARKHSAKMDAMRNAEYERYQQREKERANGDEEEDDDYFEADGPEFDENGVALNEGDRAYYEFLGTQNDVVYFDFLRLGPVAVLLGFLECNNPDLRHKLQASRFWNPTLFQLRRLAALTDCPKQLKRACDACLAASLEPTSAKACVVCGTRENTRVCARCKLAYYCGVACQKKDWSLHKPICGGKKPAATGAERMELSRAVEDDDVARLRELLGPGGVHPDTKIEGWTALQTAAMQNRYEVAKIFLEKGANINLRNSFGETALMLACMYGHVQLVELFLSHGADPHVHNQYGKSLLQCCEQSIFVKGEDKKRLISMVRDAQRKTSRA